MKKITLLILFLLILSGCTRETVTPEPENIEIVEEEPEEPVITEEEP